MCRRVGLSREVPLLRLVRDEGVHLAEEEFVHRDVGRADELGNLGVEVRLRQAFL